MLDMNSPKVWTIAGITVVALAGGAWGVWGWMGSSANASTLPKELRADALKAQAEKEPDKLRETMREAMRREDLTDEQRRELGENMRGIMQKMIQERVDEYYKAPEEEKNAVLDKHIDEMQARMKDWEQQRKDWEKQQEKDGKKPDENQARRGPQSHDERKAQSESRNPDQMAKGMAYWGAMQKRASERGIKMPQMGPGGRGGGPGRGPGGGRGP